MFLLILAIFKAVCTPSDRAPLVSWASCVLYEVDSASLCYHCLAYGHALILRRRLFVEVYIDGTGSPLVFDQTGMISGLDLTNITGLC